MTSSKMASQDAGNLAVKIREFLLDARRPVSEDELIQTIKDENTLETIGNLVKSGVVCKKDFAPYLPSGCKSMQIFWPKSLFESESVKSKGSLEEITQSNSSSNSEVQSTPCTPVQKANPLRPVGSSSSSRNSSSRLRGTYRTPFKTPRRVGLSTPKSRSGRVSVSTPLSPQEMEDKLEKLTKELKEVNEELAPLEEKYTDEDVQDYIDALHEYNEVKDAAQMLMGKLAELQGVTVKKIHEDYGVSPDD